MHLRMRLTRPWQRRAWSEGQVSGQQQQEVPHAGHGQFHQSVAAVATAAIAAVAMAAAMTAAILTAAAGDCCGSRGSHVWSRGRGVCGGGHGGFDGSSGGSSGGEGSSGSARLSLCGGGGGSDRHQTHACAQCADHVAGASHGSGLSHVHQMGHSNSSHDPYDHVGCALVRHSHELCVCPPAPQR